jgi:hypothetical protein
MDLEGIQSIAEDDYNELIISFEPPLQSNRERARKTKGDRKIKSKPRCSTEHRAGKRR